MASFLSGFLKNRRHPPSAGQATRAIFLWIKRLTISQVWVCSRDTDYWGLAVLRFNQAGAVLLVRSGGCVRCEQALSSRSAGRTVNRTTVCALFLPMNGTARRVCAIAPPRAHGMVV